MTSIGSFYKNKKVLVTGATGFKGSWLCSWLLKLGAEVYGLGFTPNKNKYLFYSLTLQKKIKLKLFDIRDFKKIKNFIVSSKASIIFHMAAQPIVRESYKEPFLTFDVNSRGTLNILESVKYSKYLKSLVCITSDKCYENIGSVKGYKEFDRLGGKDPYSASKASAELIIRSYRESIYKNKKKCGISSARAGNVIGGGDFKINRIIPDFFKSISRKGRLLIRNPYATRPWQHVLEPLSGYLILGEKTMNNKLSRNLYPSWNFGPNKKNCKKVIEVINYFYEELRLKKNYIIQKNVNLKEAQLLSLNISKANKELDWTPKLSLKECIEITSDWYINYLAGEPVERITEEQIDFYEDK